LVLSGMRVYRMAIFKVRSLRYNDEQRTDAAKLTLRQSIYPLFLVTILFLLWVRAILYFADLD
jgi:hypothetical protein